MPVAGPVPKILIAEDDDPIRALLVAAIGRRAPVIVDAARDGIEAAEKLATSAYAVVVVDLMMPRMDGFALLDHIGKQALTPRPVVFIMTAFDSQFGGREINAALVQGIIRKPFDLDVVVEMVSDCAMLHHSSNFVALTDPRTNVEPAC